MPALSKEIPWIARGISFLPRPDLSTVYLSVKRLQKQGFGLQPGYSEFRIRCRSLHGNVAYLFRVHDL
jgi:hypothetical protein